MDWFMHELRALPVQSTVLVVGDGRHQRTSERVRAAGLSAVTSTDLATGTAAEDVVTIFGARSFDVVVAQDMLNEQFHGDYEHAIAAMFSVARCSVLVDEQMPLPITIEQSPFVHRLKSLAAYGTLRVVHSTDNRMTLVFSPCEA
jgi:hypothetical protein